MNVLQFLKVLQVDWAGRSDTFSQIYTLSNKLSKGIC